MKSENDRTVMGGKFAMNKENALLTEQDDHGVDEQSASQAADELLKLLTAFACCLENVKTQVKGPEILNLNQEKEFT